MKQLTLSILLLVFVNLFAQNPDGFDKMTSKYVTGSIPLVSPSDIDPNNVVFLDARELEEYNISHIQHAIRIGFDDFNISKLDAISKDAKIVVYCSIGYRSEKIGEKLIEAGFKDVSNLNGGIFNWTNNGLPVFLNGKKTDKVHGYSESWSKWLNPNKVTVITGKKK